uniref:Uncharacterized protein n=1 Tax=Molossus molossus TaxID=27622 RepID=A0A7J8HH29_MOLMO|nr:hypothetical protein HJG59_010979 [Molossus molossus]
MDSMECYWSEVIPKGPFLIKQVDSWDVLMMLAERLCERSDRITLIRDWCSEEVVMENAKELTKVSFERTSQHLEVCMMEDIQVDVDANVDDGHVEVDRGVDVDAVHAADVAVNDIDVKANVDDVDLNTDVDRVDVNIDADVHGIAVNMDVDDVDVAD